MSRLTMRIKHHLEYLFSCKAKVKKRGKMIIVKMYSDRQTVSVVQFHKDIKLKFNQTIKVTVYGTEDHVYNKNTCRIILKNAINHDLLIPIIKNRLIETWFRPGYYLVPTHERYAEKYQSSPCVIIAIDIVKRW